VKCLIKSLSLSLSLVGRDGHGDHLPPVFGSLLIVMIQHECQNPGVWFFSWKMHSQITLQKKMFFATCISPRVRSLYTWRTVGHVQIVTCAHVIDADITKCTFCRVYFNTRGHLDACI
jgi:hypothetical protein